MASTRIIILLAIALPALVSAKEFMVGDQKGWTINFDYQQWAQDKEFHVGDKLSKLLNYSICLIQFYTFFFIARYTL